MQLPKQEIMTYYQGLKEKNKGVEMLDFPTYTI